MMADTGFPDDMAVLSGIPEHQLDETRLIETLTRMGLHLGPVRPIRVGGIAASECAVRFGKATFRLIWLLCDADVAASLQGRSPGASGTPFVPPEQTILALGWPAEALHEGRESLLPVLTVVGMLCAFLFPSQVGWFPARIWTPADQFTHDIERFVSGDLPPVFSLVAFERQPMGQGCQFQTRGLTSFSGQELRFADSQLEVSETMRRLVRIALDIIVNGPITRRTVVDGLDYGESVAIAPSGTVDGGTGVEYLDVSVDLRGP